MDSNDTRRQFGPTTTSPRSRRPRSLQPRNAGHVMLRGIVVRGTRWALIRPEDSAELQAFPERDRREGGFSHRVAPACREVLP